jgi:hypothetical protein
VGFSRGWEDVWPSELEIRNCNLQPETIELRMKAIKILLTTTLAGFGAWTQAADLVWTFDTALPSANGTFTGGTVGWNSTYKAAQYTGTAGGWTLGGDGPKFEFTGTAQTTMQQIANAGDGHISFDLTLSATMSYNSGGWTSGDWLQVHFAGNSDGAHGWTQDPAPYGPNPISGNYNPAASDTTLHVDLPFSAVGWDPGDTWFQMFFGANSATKPVQFLIDNIHAYEVPEPGALALGGLAVTALLIFRRR